MTKREMINKLKALEGKVINVETSERYAVGMFSPTASISTHILTGKCLQKRLILKVSNTYMQTQVLEEKIIGYDTPRQFAVRWIDTFLDSIKFLPHVTKEEQVETLNSLVDDFYKQLDTNKLFHERGGYIVRCDFPQAKEMEYLEDHIKIYNNKFYLKGEDEKCYKKEDQDY